MPYESGPKLSFVKAKPHTRDVGKPRPAALGIDFEDLSDLEAEVSSQSPSGSVKLELERYVARQWVRSERARGRRPN